MNGCLLRWWRDDRLTSATSTGSCKPEVLISSAICLMVLIDLRSYGLGRKYGVLKAQFLSSWVVHPLQRARHSDVSHLRSGYIRSLSKRLIDYLRADPNSSIDCLKCGSFAVSTKGFHGCNGRLPYRSLGQQREKDNVINIAIIRP